MIRTTPVRRVPAPVVVAMLGVVLAWSAAFSGIKIVLRDLEPSTLAFVRLVISGLTFLAFLPFAPRGATVRQTGDGWRFVLLGLTGSATYHLAINAGIRFIPAGMSAMIVVTMPVVVAGGAVIWLRESLGRRRLVGVLLAITGVALLLLVRSQGGQASAKGVLITLIAPTGWAVFTLVSKSMASRYDAVRLNLYGVWVGVLGTAPFGLAGLPGLGRLGWSGWLWLVYLGGIASGAAYVAYAWSLRHWTASGVASFVYLVPVLGLFWAWLLLGEVPAVLAVVAGTLIIAGVVLVQSGSRIDSRLEHPA